MAYTSMTLGKWAKMDLRAIGTPTADWLIGELRRLRAMSWEQFSELPWSGPCDPERRSWRLGLYKVVLQQEPAGGELVIERVVLGSELDRWLAEKAAAADG